MVSSVSFRCAYQACFLVASRHGQCVHSWVVIDRPLGGQLGIVPHVFVGGGAIDAPSAASAFSQHSVDGFSLNFLFPCGKIFRFFAT